MTNEMTQSMMEHFNEQTKLLRNYEANMRTFLRCLNSLYVLTLTDEDVDWCGSVTIAEEELRGEVDAQIWDAVEFQQLPKLLGDILTEIGEVLKPRLGWKHDDQLQQLITRVEALTKISSANAVGKTFSAKAEWLRFQVDYQTWTARENGLPSEYLTQLIRLGDYVFTYC